MSKSLFSLSGKTIAITGSASGIGAETALLMRTMGAHIVGLDIAERRDNVDEFLLLDLADNVSVAMAAGRLPQGLDGLCNIAGLPPRGDPGPVLKVNFYGARRFTKAALPRLKDGAAIVNVASMAGFKWRRDIERVKAGMALDDDASLETIRGFCQAHDISDVGSYLFSKALMIVWTKSLRDAVSPRHIRANSVSPGPVETPIFGDFVTAFGDKATKDIAAVGRAGRATDIAPVIAFLCCDASCWLNGIDIPVDGGLEAVMLGREHDF